MGWEKRLPLAAVGRLLLPGASGSRRCGFGAAQPRLGLGVCVGIGASRARLPVTFPKLSSLGGKKKTKQKPNKKPMCRSSSVGLRRYLPAARGTNL